MTQLPCFRHVPENEVKSLILSSDHKMSFWGQVRIANRKVPVVTAVAKVAVIPGGTKTEIQALWNVKDEQTSNHLGSFSKCPQTTTSLAWMLPHRPPSLHFAPDKFPIARNSEDFSIFCTWVLAWIEPK